MFSFVENVYDVAKPIHVWSQLIGLTSFSIRKENQTFKAHSTPFNVFCITVSTVCGTATAALFLFNFENRWNSSLVSISEVYTKSMFFVVLTFVVVSAVNNWWTFLARKRFANTLNLLHEVDEELMRLKLPVNFKRQKQIALLFVASVNLLTIVLMLVAELIRKKQKDRPRNLFLHVSLIMTVQQCIFIYFHFFFQMLAVKQRYQKINLFLRQNFLVSIRTNVERVNVALNTTASLHDKLVDVSESINRCYGIPVRQSAHLKS